MMELNFLYWKKKFSKTEMKNNICINVFCYENKSTFPIYISGQKIENSMDLLLIINEASHITCTSKILTDLGFTKQNKKYFCKSCSLF